MWRTFTLDLSATPQNIGNSQHVVLMKMHIYLYIDTCISYTMGLL